MRIIYLLVWAVCLSGCHPPQETHPFLTEMENLLPLCPDSALREMEKLYPAGHFSQNDRSHYYILLTEARHKNGISLIDSDTLIDLALAHLHRKGDPLLLSRAYLSKGRIWNELDKPEQASKTFLEGIDLLKDEKNVPDMLGKLYDELGNTYLYESLFKEALEIFGKECALDKQAGDYRGLAFSTKNIGCAHLLAGNPDSALFYFDKALQYARQSEDSLALSNILYNNMSVVHEEKGEYEKALLYLNKINSLTDNDKMQKASLLIHFNQLDSASQLLRQLTDSPDLYVQATANDYLSAIEAQRGNYRSALSHFAIYKEKSDAIYGRDKSRELKKVAHLYAIEKERIQLEDQNIRNMIVSAFSFVFLLLAMVLLHIIRKRKREKEELVREEKRKSLEQALFYRQKKNDELLQEIKALTDEIQQLKEQAGDEEQSDAFQRKVRENEEQIYLIQAKIEIQDFKSGSIHERLELIGKEKAPKLNKDEKKNLYKEIRDLLPKLVRQISEIYPAASEQDRLILCLLELGFKSPSIGNILHMSDSTVRQRKRRLKQAKD